MHSIERQKATTYCNSVLLHGSSSESDDQSIFLPRSSAFTGCASQSASPSNYPDVPINPRSIHGTSHSYLQSCFTRVADMTSRRRLRFSDFHRLEVPPVRLSIVGQTGVPNCLYLVPFRRYLASNNGVTLKFGLWVVECH